MLDTDKKTIDPERNFTFDFPWFNLGAHPEEDEKKLWRTLWALHTRASKDAHYFYSMGVPLTMWQPGSLPKHVSLLIQDMLKYNLDPVNHRVLTNNARRFSVFYTVFYLSTFYDILATQPHTEEQHRALTQMQDTLFSQIQWENNDALLAGELLAQLPQPEHELLAPVPEMEIVVS